MKKYGCRIAGCRQRGQRSDRNRLVIRFQTMNQPANKQETIAMGASWPAIDRYAIAKHAPSGGHPIHQRKNNARQRFTVFQNSAISIAGTSHVSRDGQRAKTFTSIVNELYVDIDRPLLAVRRQPCASQTTRKPFKAAFFTDCRLREIGRYEIRSQ